MCVIKHQRGQGNDEDVIIICEEAAFWNQLGFLNVVVPISSMKRSKTIFISSPSYSEFNWFQKLQNIKYPNTNDYICFTIKAELSCESCKKRGVASYCTHHNSMIPPWISDKNKFFSGLIYKALKMEKVGERELCGISDGSEGMAIDAKLIKRFSEKSFFIGESYNRPKYIGIFVDPNAGGKSSMGIISVALINGALVVCLLLFFSLNI